MTKGIEELPESSFAALVPEFVVGDLATSLCFWCDVLGFRVAYQRSEILHYLRSASCALATELRPSILAVRLSAGEAPTLAMQPTSLILPMVITEQRLHGSPLIATQSGCKSAAYGRITRTSEIDEPRTA